jgi:hypothetical protein
MLKVNILLKWDFLSPIAKYQGLLTIRGYWVHSLKVLNQLCWIK